MKTYEATTGLSKRNQKVLLKAQRLAELSSCKQRHGAIVMKHGKVLSVGVNRSRNNPDHCTDPKTQAAVHAEVAALKALPKNTDLNGASIYVARIFVNGEPAMSKPCKFCMSEIVKRGIKKIYYTVDSSITIQEEGE